MSKPVKKKKRVPVSSISAQTWWYAIGIFVLALVLYANTFRHGFVLDDDLVCAKNTYVQEGISRVGKIFSHSWYHGFTGVEDRYYRPVMLASLALDNTLFGPDSHHVINVFIYGISCALLYVLWVYLIGHAYSWLPLVATLLFTAHPLHTEVVANIKSRDELLAFFFLVLMLWGLVKGEKEGGWKWWILAAISFTLALFTKESSLTFLGLVPVTLYFFTSATWKRMAMVSGVAAVITVLFLVIRSQIVLADPTPFTITDNSLIAIDSKSTQLATAVSMIGRYVYMLLWPIPLSFDYSFAQIPAVNWWHWSVLLTQLVLAGMIYMIWRGWRSRTLPAYAIIWMAITFAVTSNLLFISGATFAERFMFIPSTGFCLLLAWAGESFVRKAPDRFLKPATAILVVILGGYGLRTGLRNADWKNDFTLFSTGIHTSPNSSRTHSFYGKSRYDLALTATPTEKQNLLDEAIKHFQHSLSIHPGFNETYHHLAQAYEAAGLTPEAAQAYEQAIQVDSTYFPAMVNVANIYYQQGNYAQAVSSLERAWRLRPDHPLINRHLGRSYQQNKQYPEAIARYKHVLSLERSEENLGNLVNVYRELGQIDTAIYYDQQIKALRGEVR